MRRASTPTGQEGDAADAIGIRHPTSEVIAGQDLTGRTAIVTGASSGLGRETARALASVGCLCDTGRAQRREAGRRGEADHREAPEATVEVGHLDFTSLAQVRQFAEEFLAANDRLHLLINNACVRPPRTSTPKRLRAPVRHESPRSFPPHLRAPAQAILDDPPSRIVNLSSGGHFSSDIIWDDPNFERHRYDPFIAYGQSKTANILFTVELEKRLSARRFMPTPCTPDWSARRSVVT